MDKLVLKLNIPQMKSQRYLLFYIYIFQIIYFSYFHLSKNIIKIRFEGSNDDDDLITQYKRSIKRTELIQNTEKGSTSAKNPVFVEWYGINYSIPNDNEKYFWERKIGDGDSVLESGPNMRTIIENIHGCANPGKL